MKKVFPTAAGRLLRGVAIVAVLTSSPVLLQARPPGSLSGQIVVRQFDANRRLVYTVPETGSKMPDVLKLGSEAAVSADLLKPGERLDIKYRRPFFGRPRIVSAQPAPAGSSSSARP